MWVFIGVGIFLLVFFLIGRSSQNDFFIEYNEKSRIYYAKVSSSWYLRDHWLGKQIEEVWGEKFASEYNCKEHALDTIKRYIEQEKKDDQVRIEVDIREFTIKDKGQDAEIKS